MSHLGRLKIFLGYISGVGKSRRMFEEAVRRRERGQDVVVGALQPEVPLEVQELIGSLEIVPLRKEAGIACLDLDTLLKRCPQICMVDGLAFENPPGSRNLKRWQDVETLLANNISVVGSLNIQHIQEQQDAIEAITGKRAVHTVPQAFVLGADEIVVVDAPVEASTGSTDEILKGISRDDRLVRLSRLRELALVTSADAVDHTLDVYLRSHEIHQFWGTQERVLVCFTAGADAAKLVESGRRMADRFHGELLAVYVRQDRLTAHHRNMLHKNQELAQAAGAHVEILEGADPVQAIVEFARARRVTQIFIGHSIGGKFWSRWFGTPTRRLIQAASDMDVQVFPH